MAISFFCEHCGTQVPLSENQCPSCKLSFYSVLCPICGKEGSPAEFRSGCPACGFKGKSIRRNKKGQGAAPVLPNPKKIKPVSRRTMPLWFYRAAVVVLLAGIIGLIALIVFTAP